MAASLPLTLIPRPRPDCIELGPVLKDSPKCGEKVRACGTHGRCTTLTVRGKIQCCDLCGDYEAPGQAWEIARRHLLYFIFPVASNGVWRRNIDELRKRLHLFNGRRAVAISTNDGLTSRGYPLDSPETVTSYFGRDEADFLIVPTVKKRRHNGTMKELNLGEVAAFVDLLKRVQPFQRHDDFTFYAHAKGVKHGDNAPAWRWAKLMYQINLDHWPLVAEAMRGHSMAGAFLCAEILGHHYPGTFYWFRNRDVFAREWTNVQQLRWGTERWPGDLFDKPQLANLFGKAAVAGLYREEEMDKQEIAYAEWKSQTGYVAQS